MRRVRFSSAAPVSFPPWPPNLRLERQGGYLCGRCGSVGGLRIASARTAFALVVSVGPVVVFLTASDPSDTALA